MIEEAEKQTGKIKEEPLTKGKKMKKLKIQLWKAQKALCMQILEQEGLPERKVNGFIKVISMPCMSKDELCLRGYDIEEDIFVDVIYFSSNTERDAYLKKAVKAITEELFTEGARPIGRTEPKIEECGQLITYAWEEK